MIELRILDGKMAGQIVVARHFPFSVGRSPDADLCLLEDGVWDNHLVLALSDKNQVLLQAGGPGGLEVNGKEVTEAVMRVGDVLRLGSVRIECEFSPVKQVSQVWREYALWGGGALLMLFELFIFFLLYI